MLYFNKYMDKKDIYEHLAKIYLDASSNKKKKSRIIPGYARNILLAAIIFVFAAGGYLLANYGKNPYRSEIALVLLNDSAKINFHFDPAKKEVYTLDLNHLNLGRFNTIGFHVKKADQRDIISLRVEFTNSFREKSEVYVRDIPRRWKDYRISLSDFKGINDWSDITALSFTVEEWNVMENNGVVYLDNVRLIK